MKNYKNRIYCSIRDKHICSEKNINSAFYTIYGVKFNLSAIYAHFWQFFLISEVFYVRRGVC